MNTPELGNVPIEDDPTGMRALLSSLPDPGPMPEELSARILAALEREARYAETGSIWDEEPPPEVPDVPERPVTHPPAQGAHSTVTPLVRKRLRWQPLLAAAAAAGVLAFGGGAIFRLLNTGANSNNSAVGGAQNDASVKKENVKPAAPAATAHESSAAASASSSAEAGGGYAAGFRVLASGTAYSATDFAAQAGRVLSAPAPGSSTTPAGGLAVESAARACAKAVGAPESGLLVVDFGTFDDSPAVLIVVEGTTGDPQAYVVTPECSATDDTVLAGPAAVG